MKNTLFSSKFLTLGVLFLWTQIVLTACAPLGPKPAGQKADLLILHVNDTHAHVAGLDEQGKACFDDSKCFGGLARISQAILDAKARGENVLALDAGDMFTGTMFFSVHKWPLQASLNQLLPYDAATLGNHEWDQGCAELANYLAHPRPFPMLAANLTPEKGCPLFQSETKPYLIKTIGGHKVGIIGLANDEVVGLANACPQTKFAERVATVQKMVRELEEQGVKRIVLLTHLGLSADRKLAQSVEGIDVIVGGHSHTYLGPDSPDGPYPVLEHSPLGRPVLVVTAKCRTEYLGELACNFDQDGVLTSYHGSAKKLLPSLPRDPKVSAKVAEYLKSLEAYRQKKIGRHDLNFGPDGLEACRQGECLTGLIITQAMLEYGRKKGAELAVFNGGGVRAALGPGDITQGDLLNAFPFDNKIILRSYTGKQICEALEHGLAGENAKGPQLLQVAGLRYKFDPNKPKGQRLQSAEILDPQGQSRPLRPKKRYLVVVPEYLVKGGDFFAMLTKGKSVNSPEIKDIEVLKNYLERHKPLRSIPHGHLQEITN